MGFLPAESREKTHFLGSSRPVHFTLAKFFDLCILGRKEGQTHEVRLVQRAKAVGSSKEMNAGREDGE